MLRLTAGIVAVQAIQLRAGKEDHQTRRLTQTARKLGIPLERVTAEDIERLAGGKTHGGVLAQVGSYKFTPLAGLLGQAAAPFIAMIDGVEDPFNFGSSVRALYAAGADGLVLRPRNWLSAAGIVARASAGASELLPTALAETAAEAADFFRTSGLVIACASDTPGSVSLYDADLTRPLFLLIGGEKRGITRSFLDTADLKLRIPYGRPLPHSLGTASATAIIAFEVMRQRMTIKTQPPIMGEHEKYKSDSILILCWLPHYWGLWGRPATPPPSAPCFASTAGSKHPGRRRLRRCLPLRPQS